MVAKPGNFVAKDGYLQFDIVNREASPKAVALVFPSKCRSDFDKSLRRPIIIIA